MTTLEQIEKDYVQAFKNKEVSVISTFRLLLAALQNEKIKLKTDLKEEDVIKIVKSEIKKRKESIEEYDKANRQDLADKEKNELNTLEKYLQEQMSEEEIKIKVLEVLNKLDDKDNLGKVIGQVMAVLKGQADGNLVRKIVEKEMNK